MLRAALCLLVGVVSPASAQPTVPASWPESSQWRLDRLWPDDPWNPQAYIPMVWSEDRWVGKSQMFEGLPHARVEEQSLLLASGASRFGAEYHKAPVLVCKVQQPGVYGLSGLAMGVEKTGPVELMLARKTWDSVSLVHRWLIQPGQTRPLDKVAAEVQPGDELVLVPWVRQANARSTVRLIDLKFSPALADQQVQNRLAAIAVMPCQTLISTPSPQAVQEAHQAVIDAGPGGIVFPADSGVINVKAFGAVGDGVHDDTAALRAAFRSSGLIYIPNGTYLVTGSIEPPTWVMRVPSRRVLQGQSREHTIIELVDHMPGFDRPDQPFSAVLTS